MDNNKKNNSKKTRTNCKDNNSNSNNSQEKCSLGLDRFSYADYVLLSSTIAYAISEELNDTDLALFLSFLGMVSSDLAMLITKKRTEEAKKGAQQVENGTQNIIVEDISQDVVVGDLTRKPKKTKIRKKYVRRKKKNDC